MILAVGTHSVGIFILVLWGNLIGVGILILAFGTHPDAIIRLAVWE